MQPRAYVTSRPLSFGHSFPQAEGIEWMKAALRQAAEHQPIPDLTRALRFYDLLARSTQIGARTTCLDDRTHHEWAQMHLSAESPTGNGQSIADAPPWHRATLDARMEVFAETALALARDAFAADVEGPDALIQVSCTGYDSPTAVQRVAAEKGWTEEARLLHVGHMGCYAALPAIAVAADLAAARAAARVIAGGGDEADARTAILLVELCTLHHNPATTDIEQIVQQCLFADGAARVDVTLRPPTGERAFALLDHFETLVPSSLDAMTWRVADAGFRMTLSRAVPDHIRAALGPAVERFLARHGLTVADVQWFAIHPGGPRVIESSAEALGLSDEVVRHSHEVLYARGNMSSTTLPHIWAALADDPAVQAGDLVVSVAFGPGLTVAGNLMRVEG